MLKFLKRRQQLREEKQRHRDEQDARIERGFREIDTAVKLIQQMARGELPPIDIVEIGDGFYAEHHEDGSLHTVFLDQTPVLGITAPELPNSCFSPARLR